MTNALQSVLKFTLASPKRAETLFSVRACWTFWSAGCGFQFWVRINCPILASHRAEHKVANVCICPDAYISQCEFSLTIQLASEKELRYLCSSYAFSLNFGRPACPLITAVLLASFFSELTPHASAHESPKSVLVEGPTGDMSKGWRHPGKFCKRISFPDAVRLNWPQTALRVSLTQNRPPPR